jgi:hypothetical protein
MKLALSTASRCVQFFIALAIFASSPLSGISAQELDENGNEIQSIAIKSRGLQRVGNTFESIWLIDNQTVQVPLKGTLEFDIQHRFGTINNGYDDLWGFYAPSNIRLGFGYTPITNLMIGFGLTKDRMLWDFNWKYALLTEQKGFPVSVTYYGNVAVDTRTNVEWLNDTDKFTYFHQLMVARKVTTDFSIQTSFNISHFNAVEGFVNSNGELDGKMENTHFSVSLLGRYKVSDALAFIGNYDQPITQHKTNNPNPNLSFGFELATPLHAFQVFVGNYRWMVPQYSNVLNNNNFSDKQFLIGFNITRLLDMKMESLTEMIFKRKSKHQ